MLIEHLCMICALNFRFILVFIVGEQFYWPYTFPNILLCHMHHTNTNQEVNAQVIPTSKQSKSNICCEKLTLQHVSQSKL